MKILIDADGCPVVDLTVRIAAQYKVPVLILCDTAHQIQRKDYGLASMCLARRARVLNQNGLEYTPENIDGLLFRRHENKKLLRAGKHPKGVSKRTKEQDTTYKNALEKILQTV